MTPARADPATLLRRAIKLSAREAGVAVAIVAAQETPWMSAVFSGTLHRLTLAVMPIAAVDEWLATLEDRDLALRGHIVASLAATRTAAGLAIDALTLEDDPAAAPDGPR